MRLLITGITGQDGWWLAKAAIAADNVVYGLIRGQNNPKEPEIAAELPEVRRLHGDLLDASSIDKAVADAKPDAIVNLGAMTFVPASWEAPELALRTIAEGTLNVLNAAVRNGVRRVVQASTSEMFGNAANTIEGLAPGNDNAYLLDEHSPMYPASPYGTAKLAAHHLCRNYRDAYGLSTVSAIMFNHESTRRPPIFVTRKITQGVALIAAGKMGELQLGNMDAARDWGWAPDYMEALLLLCAAEKPSESYVIATGKTATVGDFARYAFDLVGIFSRMKTDPALRRPSEVWALRGDPSRIKAELGWEAKHDWRDVCRLMLAHDLRLEGQLRLAEKLEVGE